MQWRCGTGIAASADSGTGTTVCHSFAPEKHVVNTEDH